ncbi:MAG: hypothetical protein V2A77_02700 [Pseudomonadota bacterium]
MITRWYISPVVMVDGARTSAVRAEIIQAFRAGKLEPGESCYCYSGRGKTWFVTKALASPERHEVFAGLAGVFIFDGTDLAAKADGLNQLSRNFLTLRGIEAKGTVGDVLEAIVKHHEPAASVAATWAGRR